MRQENVVEWSIIAHMQGFPTIEAVLVSTET